MYILVFRVMVCPNEYNPDYYNFTGVFQLLGMSTGFLNVTYSRCSSRVHVLCSTSSLVRRAHKARIRGIWGADRCPLTLTDRPTDRQWYHEALRVWP